MKEQWITMLHRGLEFLADLTGGMADSQKHQQSISPSDGVLSAAVLSPRNFCIRDQFLSNKETELYRWLNEFTEGRAVVCPKVRVTDVLRVIDAPHHFSEAVAIDRKSISFLICNPETMRPVLAIDAGDGRDSVIRNSSIGRAFRGAGLAVMQIADPDPVSAAEVRATIRKRIEDALSFTSSSKTVASVT